MAAAASACLPCSNSCKCRAFDWPVWQARRGRLRRPRLGATGLIDVVDVERLLALPTVDIIYISTPPFLHYDQAKQALTAGKHVICEKPLALTVEQADELVAIARRQDRLLVANLMQRYNPLFGMVGQLIEKRLLGELLHGYFENYASDENLPAEHWFWDPEKSGGIFIEHGVHFFDMFAGWLGAGEVVAAQASRRRGTNIEDQVQCTVRYGDEVHINFYHGFQQTGRMDRQELRLVFERGDLLLQRLGANVCPHSRDRR